MWGPHAIYFNTVKILQKNIHCILKKTPFFNLHKNQTKYLSHPSVSLSIRKILKVKQEIFKSEQYFTAVFFLELVVVEEHVDDHNAHTYFCFGCMLAIPKNHFKPECCYSKYSSKDKVSSMYGNCVYGAWGGVCMLQLERNPNYAPIMKLGNYDLKYLLAA